MNDLFIYSGQRMLEECEIHVAEEEKRMENSKERLERSSRVLTDAKSGIDHLAKKLFAIKTVCGITILALSI